MIALEHQRSHGHLVLVLTILDASRLLKVGVILNECAVLIYGHVRLLTYFAVGVEAGSVEKDIIGLPLSSLLTSVYHSRLLIVKGSAAILVRRLLSIRVEYLHFVSTHQAYSAIAICDWIAVGVGWAAKFDMKIDITEILFGSDILAIRSEHADGVHDPCGIILGIALIPVVCKLLLTFTDEDDGALRRLGWEFMGLGGGLRLCGRSRY